MGVLACERNPAGSVDIRQGATTGRGEDDQEFQRDPVMLITICRLYDSYSDANRVVLMLEAAGLPASETSVISNNSVVCVGAGAAAMIDGHQCRGAARRPISQSETE
jgi:hypothetical protein